MALTFPTIVTDSLARQIAESIRRAIVSGEIAIDERLPTEAELGQQFGVSRPTIREALKRLAAENLILSRRGPAGGTFVRRPSDQEFGGTLANAMRLLVSVGEFKFEDIIEIRFEMESLCCRLAAARSSKINFSVMKKELARQRDAELSDVEFCASDVSFHNALAEAAHNAVLRFVMLGLNESLNPVTNLILFRFRERTIIAKQHEQLLSALQAGDVGAAIGALEQQKLYLRKQYGEARHWKTRKRRKA